MSASVAVFKVPLEYRTRTLSLFDAWSMVVLDSAALGAAMKLRLVSLVLPRANWGHPAGLENIDKSVMMVTALSPIIGYDQASVISHYAIDNNLTLREAALKNGVTAELFDRVVVPINMTHPDGAAPAKKRASSAAKPAARRRSAK